MLDGEVPEKVERVWGFPVPTRSGGRRKWRPPPRWAGGKDGARMTMCPCVLRGSLRSHLRMRRVVHRARCRVGSTNHLPHPEVRAERASKDAQKRSPCGCKAGTSSPKFSGGEVGFWHA